MTVEIKHHKHRRSYRAVSEQIVWHHWYCGCGAVGKVRPNWYQDNGTPTCHDCGRDMKYEKTTVLLPWGRLP